MLGANAMYILYDVVSDASSVRVKGWNVGVSFGERLYRIGS